MIYTSRVLSSDEEYMDFVDQEVKESDAYQIMITSSTYLSSHVEQFRPGYTFKKLDRDGTTSKVSQHN